MAKKKAISQRNISYGEKQAKSSNNPDSYLHLQPSWRFERVDNDGKWSLQIADWHKLLSCLANFERMTWDEIRKQTHDRGKNSNHHIPPVKMCKEAQDRFSELKLDEHADNVFSLRLDNKTRLFGLLYGGVFSILWYDKNHEVCPSHLKHT